MCETFACYTDSKVVTATALKHESWKLTLQGLQGTSVRPHGACVTRIIVQFKDIAESPNRCCLKLGNGRCLTGFWIHMQPIAN